MANRISGICFQFDIINTIYILTSMRERPTFILLMIVLFLFSAYANQEQVIEWEWLDFSVAYPAAKKSNKHLIINFYSIGCGWCRKMDNSTFGNIAIAKHLNENFIGAKINIASNRKIDWMGEELTERELAVKLAGRGTPYTTFIDTSGNVVAKLPGYIPAERFIFILDYVAGYWYEDLSYQEYLISSKIIEAQDKN